MEKKHVNPVREKRCQELFWIQMLFLRKLNFISLIWQSLFISLSIKEKIKFCVLFFKYTLRQKINTEYYMTLIYVRKALEHKLKNKREKYLLCCAGFSQVIFNEWGIKHLSLLPAGVNVKNCCHSLACYSICTRYNLSHGHLTHGNLIRIGPMTVYSILSHGELKQFYKVLRVKY